MSRLIEARPGQRAIALANGAVLAPGQRATIPDSEWTAIPTEERVAFFIDLGEVVDDTPYYEKQRYTSIVKGADNPTDVLVGGTYDYAIAQANAALVGQDSALLYVDEGAACVVGDVAYWVSGWSEWTAPDGSDLGRDYLPYILRYDLANDRWLSSVKIPAPDGAVPSPGWDVPIVKEPSSTWAPVPGSSYQMRRIATVIAPADNVVVKWSWTPVPGGDPQMVLSLAAPNAPFSQGNGWLDSGSYQTGGFVTGQSVELWVGAVGATYSPSWDDKVDAILASLDVAVFRGTPPEKSAAIAGWGFEGGYYGAIGSKVYFGGGDSNLYDPRDTPLPAVQPIDPTSATDWVVTPPASTAIKCLGAMQVPGRYVAEITISNLPSWIDRLTLAFHYSVQGNSGGDSEALTPQNGVQFLPLQVLAWTNSPYLDLSVDLTSDVETPGWEWVDPEISVVLHPTDPTWSSNAGGQLMSYDTVTGEFATLAVKPHGFDYGAFGVADGKLFAISGWTLDVYDPQANAWTSYTAPPECCPWNLGGGIPDWAQGIQVGRWLYWPDMGVKLNLDADPTTTEAWVALPDIPLTGWNGFDWDAAIAVDPDGKIHWWASSNTDGGVGSHAVLDPADDSWTVLVDANATTGAAIDRSYFSAILNTDGDWRFIGGGVDVQTTVLQVDPVVTESAVPTLLAPMAATISAMQQAGAQFSAAFDVSYGDPIPDWPGIKNLNIVTNGAYNAAVASDPVGIEPATYLPGTPNTLALDAGLWLIEILGQFDVTSGTAVNFIQFQQQLGTWNRYTPVSLDGSSTWSITFDYWVIVDVPVGQAQYGKVDQNMQILVFGDPAAITFDFAQMRGFRIKEYT